MALPAIAGHSYPNELILGCNHTLISLKIKGNISGYWSFNAKPQREPWVPDWTMVM